MGTTGREGKKGTVCGGVRNGNQLVSGVGWLGLSFSYLGSPRSAVQMGRAIPGQLLLEAKAGIWMVGLSAFTETGPCLPVASVTR